MSQGFLFDAFSPIVQEGKDKKLSTAIKRDNVKMVRQAIAEGANVNGSYYNAHGTKTRVSMLVAAIQNSHENVIDELLEKGADAKKSNENVLRAVLRYRSACPDCGSIIQKFIDNGADVNGYDYDFNKMCASTVLSDTREMKAELAGNIFRIEKIAVIENVLLVNSAKTTEEYREQILQRKMAKVQQQGPSLF